MLRRVDVGVGWARRGASKGLEEEGEVIQADEMGCRTALAVSD